MSDSTIDDALRLLESGKGNPERLKQIIESFQKRSMISMQDRKYVDALVEQYLTPRHRQMTSKMKPSDRQKTSFPRIRRTTESAFKITEVKATTKKKKPDNPYIKSTAEEIIDVEKAKFCIKCGVRIYDDNEFCTKCGAKKTEIENSSKKELTPKEPTIEEKFIKHVESDRSTTKKKGKGKTVGIIVGIIVVIVIGSGAVYMGSNSDLFLMETEIEERMTCQDDVLLVSTTKIPNFPEAGKDLQHYLDRYDNEPNYKDWFDRNFPGQTVREVLVPQMGEKETIIPGFPDPEKDLQHYLDRYDNEPNYKDWFDRNFPGQTVREAVC